MLTAIENVRTEGHKQVKAIDKWVTHRQYVFYSTLADNTKTFAHSTLSKDTGNRLVCSKHSLRLT